MKQGGASAVDDEEASGGRLELKFFPASQLGSDTDLITQVRAGGIELDVRTRRAGTQEADVELTAKEFSLLETFLRHPGQVLSREQLLSRVWGYDFDPGSNVVDVYVRYLREKIGRDAIATVRGRGYRLDAR